MVNFHKFIIEIIRSVICVENMFDLDTKVLILFIVLKQNISYLITLDMSNSCKSSNRF